MKYILNIQLLEKIYSNILTYILHIYCIHFFPCGIMKGADMFVLLFILWVKVGGGGREGETGEMEG